MLLFSGEDSQPNKRCKKKIERTKGARINYHKKANQHLCLRFHVQNKLTIG